MSCPASARGSPMPESISSCGELTTPAARITSRAARARCVRPRRRYLDPHRAPALDEDARRLSPDQDGETAPPQRRAQIGVGRAAPAAPVDGHLQAGEALLAGAVVVVGPGMACLPACLAEGLDQGIGIFAGLHAQRTAVAAEAVGPALPAFLALEIGQQAGERPLGQTPRLPVVIVAAMPADMGHGIDRRRAADDLAAGAFDAASADAGFRLAEIHPVVQAVLEDLAPAERDVDQGIAVPAAGLQQQHAARRVRGETVWRGRIPRSRHRRSHSHGRRSRSLSSRCPPPAGGRAVHASAPARTRSMMATAWRVEAAWSKRASRAAGASSAATRGSSFRRARRSPPPCRVAMAWRWTRP